MVITVAARKRYAEEYAVRDLRLRVQALTACWEPEKEEAGRIIPAPSVS